MEPASPQPLPPEIRVEQVSPDEIRYVLPRRPLGKWRWTAAVPIVCALVSLTFLWDWFTGIGGWPAQMPGAVAILFQAIGLASAIPMVLLPIAVGLAIAWGHSEIEIRDGRIYCSERAGVLRWRRRRKLANVNRLVVCSPHAKDAPAGNPKDPLNKFVAIRAEVIRGKPLWGAIGYPREWLVPLAHELARHVRAAQPDLSQPTIAADSQAEVIEELVVVEDDRIPGIRFDQPGGSLIIMTEQSGGFAFEIPPAGIKRGAGGLFVFACLWLAMLTLMSGGLLFAVLRPAQQQPGSDSAKIALVMGLFWLIGIGLMLLALHMARRRAAIAVADGRCWIVQAGLFGEKAKVWEPGELRMVQVGPSGMEVNDEPVMELQFIPAQGQKFGVLSGRDVPELEWLATHLTRALRLTPSIVGAAVMADVDVQPAESNVVCEQLPGALTIRIPRAPFGKGQQGWWGIAILWNGGIAAFTVIFFVFMWQGLAQPLFPIAVLSLMECIGIALLGAAIHMTIRHAEIAFADRRLLLVTFGLFGIRRHEWAAEELAAIRSAASDTRVNARRLMQLQFVPVDGKSVSLFTGRDDQELAWIATQLRRATKLPAETPAERQSRLAQTAAFYPRSASGTQARSGGPV